MIRSLNLLCQGHLAVDAADGFSAGETITFFETCDLCFSVGGDDDDFVHAFVYASFKEERYVVDHHSVRVFLCCLFCQPRLFACNTGVDDVFKSAQLGPVSENNGS
jgi:hypothetical protein